MSLSGEPEGRGPKAASGAPPAEVVESLVRRGLPEAEVYAKRGRARVLDRSPYGAVVSIHREEGWAVRAGDDRRSFFAAGTGRPDPAGPGGHWPEADGERLVLPEPGAVRAASGAWSEPADFDTPLIGEREGIALLDALGAALAEELPAAGLLAARLADGASEAEIASSRGIEAAVRSRTAYLRLEAAIPGDGARAAVELAGREARSFEPRAIARRLADRLTVSSRGRSPERDRADMLLTPQVAVRLLAGLLPLFVGARGAELAERLEDRHGRFAARALTVVDHPRLAEGALNAPVDGEGLPTAEVVLVEAGAFRQPLVPWTEAGGSPRAGRRPGGAGLRPVACARRPGWRDLPAPGPSHLFVQPDEATAVGELLADLARGYYLLDAAGPGLFDFEQGRFSLPVVGFAVERGQAAAPLAGARLQGALGALLRGVDGVARDLAFFPLAGGMLGAPTLRVRGLELVRG